MSNSIINPISGILTTALQQQLLAEWFGPIGENGVNTESRQKLWWSKSEDIDAQLKETYQAVIEQLLAIEVDSTEATFIAESLDPKSRLVAILLLDQLPRNIFRDTPRAFAGDSLARRLSKRGIELKHDEKLQPIERVFFYLPLEHSESLDDQNWSVQLFAQLEKIVTPDVKTSFSFFLEFAKKHEVIIARFHRFPHRNAILKRESTPFEVQFLTEAGSSF